MFFRSCFSPLPYWLFQAREPFPKVSFIALETVEGFVSFKATSPNADTYLWDFGVGYRLMLQIRAISTHITERMLLHLQQKEEKLRSSRTS